MSDELGSLVCAKLKQLVASYNQYKDPQQFNYIENVVIYQQLTSQLPKVITNTHDAHKLHVMLFVNKHHKVLKMSNVDYHPLTSHLGCCHFQLIFEHKESILQKITIKDVDMDKLMKDLNKNNIKVNEILKVIESNPDKLDPLLEYLKKANISITSVLTILFRNNVTVGNLLSNPFIFNLIKQSKDYSWILSSYTHEPPSITCKSVAAHRTVQVYMIWKLKHDKQIALLNLNYNVL